MVHNIAKTLIIIFVSVMFALASTVLVGLIVGPIAGRHESSSDWTTLAYANLAFGWLIYAIPFAIIGFKVYPKPKTSSVRNK